MISVRHYTLVRLYLAWHAITAFGFGLELVAAPQRLISGTSTRTVFSLRPPWQWGVVFLLLAVVCAASVRWPLQAWRPAILALGVVQVCWALALLAPLFAVGRTNLLAPVPWIALATTTVIIAVYTVHEERRPLDAGRG